MQGRGKFIPPETSDKQVGLFDLLIYASVSQEPSLSVVIIPLFILNYGVNTMEKFILTIYGTYIIMNILESIFQSTSFHIRTFRFIC